MGGGIKTIQLNENGTAIYDGKSYDIEFRDDYRIINTDLYNAVVNDYVTNIIRILIPVFVPIVTDIISVGYYLQDNISGLQLVHSAGFGMPLYNDSLFRFILLEKS